MKETDGPIVAAVREAQAKIAAKCNYDVSLLIERLRKTESEHSGQICTPKHGQHGTTPVVPKPT